MMKTAAQLDDFESARSGKPGAGPWLRLTRSLSAFLLAVRSWSATAYRARRDMEQLGRMSERELKDIGLIRQDLYDLRALPISQDPTEVLGLRVCQRKQARRDRVTRLDRSNVAPWGL